MIIKTSAEIAFVKIQHPFYHRNVLVNYKLKKISTASTKSDS